MMGLVLGAKIAMRYAKVTVYAMKQYHTSLDKFLTFPVPNAKNKLETLYSCNYILMHPQTYLRPGLMASKWENVEFLLTGF